ncbi:hypothetical protein HMPREF9999_01940 [Alloprevotella sp. oral taxon 473 str. F0040]|nr:hypothetical protein HMPREF9999_01940 [Alloprevotella sp. oral taxon 473 str. F0040]
MLALTISEFFEKNSEILRKMSEEFGKMSEIFFGLLPHSYQYL